MDTTTLALMVISAFDSIGLGISVYMFYRFMLRPSLKFRHAKKRGYYVDLHKFDKRGYYAGSLENISLDETAEYVGRKIFGVLPKSQGMEGKVRDRIRYKMDREADKMIDIILDSRQAKEQLQRYVFKKIKKEFDIGDMNGTRHKVE